MEFDYRMLRGRIREKYGTEEDFAREMRMSAASLRQKFRNEGDFTMGQMLKAAQLLGIDAVSIPKYFFVERVQKNEFFAECQRRGTQARTRYLH